MKTFSPLIEPMQLLAGWAQSETDAESVGEAILAAMARGRSSSRVERNCRNPFGKFIASPTTPVRNSRLMVRRAGQS